MSSPTDRIRLWVACEHGEVGWHGLSFGGCAGGSWATDAEIIDAARSFIGGAPIQWCENHERPDGFGHVDIGSCSIVTRWLSERPAAHLPGDDDE